MCTNEICIMDTCARHRERPRETSNRSAHFNAWNRSARNRTRTNYAYAAVWCTYHTHIYYMNTVCVYMFMCRTITHSSLNPLQSSAQFYAHACQRRYNGLDLFLRSCIVVKNSPFMLLHLCGESVLVVGIAPFLWPQWCLQWVTCECIGRLNNRECRESN